MINYTMDIFNKKHKNLLKLSELKIQIRNHRHIINPSDIVFSIRYYINKLTQNGVKITKNNRHLIILSIYILFCKYTIDNFSVEINSLNCGIPLNDYILYEKLILNKLNWALEIPRKIKT